MSKHKEILEKIKNALNFNEEIVVEKFEDVALADESIVKIEPAVEVGAVVSKETAEGMEVLEAGVYELADGRKIEIVEGVIASIEEVAEAEEEMEAEEVAEEMSEETLTKIVEAVKSVLNAEFEKLEVKLSEVSKENKALKSELTKSNEAVIEAFEDLAKEPIEETPKKRGGYSALNKKKTNIFLKK